jgi:5-methyltetrahydrofolate--homocysteine methyltransferase
MIDKEMFDSAISRGSIEEVKKLTEDALKRGESEVTVLEEGLIPALGKVGDKFKCGEAYLPELLVAGLAMRGAMSVLRTRFTKFSGSSVGRVVFGTVKGDVHDIGKNLVIMMLEGAAFEVIDLGTDVSSDKFLEAIEKHHPHIVGMSALLSTTMEEMKNTIEAIEKAGLQSKIKTIIGGAPVTEIFAKNIGANGCAPDAYSAVAVAKSLLPK